MICFKRQSHCDGSKHQFSSFAIADRSSPVANVLSISLSTGGTKQHLSEPLYMLRETFRGRFLRKYALFSPSLPSAQQEMNLLILILRGSSSPDCKPSQPLWSHWGNQGPCPAARKPDGDRRLDGALIYANVPFTLLKDVSGMLTVWMVKSPSSDLCLLGSFRNLKRRLIRKYCCLGMWAKWFFFMYNVIKKTVIACAYFTYKIKSYIYI